MKFKEFEIKDIEKLKSYIIKKGESCCDTAVANLMVWQGVYHNRFCEEDGVLYLRSGEEPDFKYSLPFCDDLRAAVEYIKNQCGKYPRFYAQEGARLDEFKRIYGNDYIFCEYRDAFDYIYNREDLATLKGKKYHGKRNHISAFSKQYNWKYEKVDASNTDKVKECAKKWYQENKDRFDGTMECEQKGLYMLLDNLDKFSARAGAITVDGNVVAFTLGTPLNRETFDIHIEKALKSYETAYTVINQQFAENELNDFEYINREDDLGLAGLRKAKLSYKPQRLLKKYFCIPKSDADYQKCRKIYNEAFTPDLPFDDILFERFFGFCKYLKENGEVVSMLFTFPFTLKTADYQKYGFYIYGVATDKAKRGKGYMKKLLSILESSTYILKPVNETLFAFYEKAGFKRAKCSIDNTEKSIILTDEIEPLISISDNEESDFEIMYKSSENIDFSDAAFPCTMH